MVGPCIAPVGAAEGLPGVSVGDAVTLPIVGLAVWSSPAVRGGTLSFVPKASLGDIVLVGEPVCAVMVGAPVPVLGANVGDVGRNTLSDADMDGCNVGLEGLKVIPVGTTVFVQS